MKSKWYLVMAIVLIAISTSIYLTQVYVFHKVDDTLFYLFQDLSFVPINVLLVTLILDRLLKKREKQSLLNKMNMVIGVFYNDIGNELLDLLGKFAVNINEISSRLQISASWDKKDFKSRISQHFIDPEKISLNSELLLSLKVFLIEKKQGLLNMLSNPNLLEHDSFTNLLWAVFHLADELYHRTAFDNLPETDLKHLRGDMVRAYQLLVHEWLSYMKHLQSDYPYLYSIAIRTNPFNPEAKITVS